MFTSRIFAPARRAVMAPKIRGMRTVAEHDLDPSVSHELTKGQQGAPDFEAVPAAGRLEARPLRRRQPGGAQERSPFPCPRLAIRLRRRSSSLLEKRLRSVLSAPPISVVD